jgi:uncharacterized protein YceH (UPF0502 family)
MNDSASATSAGDQESPRPRWTAVPAIERRILGVLVEKAKTVPESYPMTLNGIVTGCNQKNNRYPLMQLEPEKLDDPLERLRNLGAIALVQGSGRVEKYRHYLSDWLGVDKFELAVMTELLLRGAQTEGELRQRASRMEAIADLPQLRTILKNLEQRGLVISLTSAGRGHVISHNLYEPRELEKVRREFEAAGPATAADDDEPAVPQASAAPRSPSHASGGDWRSELGALRAEVTALKEQVEGLREDVARLRGM